MRLAPEVQSLIDWEKSIGHQYGDVPLSAARWLLRDESDAELRRRGVVAEDVAAVDDHQVPVAGGEIVVRAFTPSGPGPYPVFLHCHGGGFALGTIDSLFNTAKCARVCNGAACVVVTVEYRLAPEFPFPTAPEDCYAALIWTATNAEWLGVDASRIAVGGESAGGNLAAVVALMTRDRGGPALALQLLEAPVTDLSNGAADHPSVALFGEGYGLDRAAMDEFTRTYLPDPGAGSHPYASPLLADNLAGVASAHVLTAEQDILRDSGEAYARRLEEAGVRTTLRRMRGHTHASSVLWQTWEPARAWMDDVLGTVRHALHDGGSE